MRYILSVFSGRGARVPAGEAGHFGELFTPLSWGTMVFGRNGSTARPGLAVTEEGDRDRSRARHAVPPAERLGLSAAQLGFHLGEASGDGRGVAGHEVDVAAAVEMYEDAPVLGVDPAGRVLVAAAFPVSCW